MSYDHVQYGRWHYIFWLVAVVLLVGGWTAGERQVLLLNLAIAGMFLLISLMMASLRVRDDSDHLSLCFGPLPVFRRQIPYAEMQSVEADRSRLIDGWGIHYIFGRGWTYNLWGFDCVKLTLQSGKIIRIGTDDRAGLLAFLQTKLAQRSAQTDAPSPSS